MNDLSQKKCANHAPREAVACCPECGRFFCRECVTEHKGRVLCAACLEEKRVGPEALSRAGVLGRILHFAGGTLVLWVCFYYLGRLMCALPEAFHEGTLWK